MPSAGPTAMPTLVPITTCWPSISYGLLSSVDDAVREIGRIRRLAELRPAGWRIRRRPCGRWYRSPAPAHAGDRRHLAQQLVAGRVAQRVVDGLEEVEVEQMEAMMSPRLTRVSACSSRSLNSTRLGRPVSVSCSAMCTILASELPLLGDVLVGCDCTTIRHRLSQYGDAPAILQVVDVVRRLRTFGRALQRLQDGGPRLGADLAIVDVMLNDLSQTYSGSHLIQAHLQSATPMG